MEAEQRQSALTRWRPTLIGLGWVAGLVLFYLLLKYVAPYFTPFLVALVLAVLINPTVDALEERTRLPRGWAVAIALLFFFGLALGFILFAVGAVVVQLGQLVADFPQHYNDLVAFSELVIARVTEVFRGLPPDFVSLTDSTVRSGLQSIYGGLQTLVRALLSGLVGLPQAFLVAVVSLVATFFFSRDKDVILEFSLGVLPAPYRERVARVNRDVVRSAVGLVKAQLILVGITLVIIVSGLLLLRVRYAWIVGLVAGLLDILPAVGPATVLVPWGAYCLLTGDHGLGLGLLALVAVVTVFRQVMEPRIVGQRIGLHPLLTLFSLYLGFRLLGATGLVVGPLVAIAVRAVIQSGRTPPVTRRPRERKAAEPPEGDPGLPGRGPGPAGAGPAPRSGGSAS